MFDGFEFHLGSILDPKRDPKRDHFRIHLGMDFGRSEPEFRSTSNAARRSACGSFTYIIPLVSGVLNSFVILAHYLTKIHLVFHAGRASCNKYRTT